MQTSYLRQRTNISVTESTWKTCPKQQHIPASQKREGHIVLWHPVTACPDNKTARTWLNRGIPTAWAIWSCQYLTYKRLRCLNYTTVWVQDCINRTAPSQRIRHLKKSDFFFTNVKPVEDIGSCQHTFQRGGVWPIVFATLIHARGSHVDHNDRFQFFDTLWRSRTITNGTHPCNSTINKCWIIW